MGASEELLKRNEVAEALAHLLSVDGNHVVVHPVVNHLVALRSHSLRYLALMMREDEVHAASVNIEMAAQIFSAHSSTLAMPAGETIAPRTWPAHDVLGRGLLPKGKVGLIFLLADTGKLTAFVDDIL